MKPTRTIMLEEAIRSLAFGAIILLGVLPTVYALGGTSPVLLLALLALPLVYFPIGVWIRLRTGRALMVMTARGWLITVGVTALLSAALIVSNSMRGTMSPSMAFGQVVVSVVVLLVLSRMAWNAQRKP